jgi:opacity protein-like surface antigen
MPAAAHADDQALQVKVEDLTRKVNKLEEHSLSRWLEVGGDFRFRFDSLRGEAASFTSPSATFSWLGQNALIALPNNDPALNAFGLGGQSVGVALGMANSMMQNVKNYSQASAQAANFRTLLGHVGAGVGGQLFTNGAGFATPPVNGQQLGAAGVQVPAYKPKNDSLYTNRFGLDLHAKATQNVTVNVRLVAYKTFGAQDDSAVTNGSGVPFFADRVGVFDGTIGHVPSSSLLDVDRAYATWSNIADQPIWFSVGRRPSTNGAPSNLRLNNERPGNGGTPALLVDYAFDGMTLGWAPDIEALPGAYAKVCYGRGYESGFEQPTGNSLNDTDMLGIAVIPVDTDPLRVWLQWNRGMNIFDFPTMSNTAFGNTAPSVNLGSIDWYGAGFMSTLKNVGPGNLNFFADGGLSITHPSDAVSANAGFEGLMTGQFLNPEAPSKKTGWAAYAGARYDFPTNTKLGVEYNHGSKNWITFAPAADDIWTTKLGTRGDVYETYLIQELNLKPISSRLSKAFFRLGYQYYNFDYTGSNNWVGAPVKVSDVKPTDMMLLTPLKNAQDIYLTFEVKF